MTRVSSWMVRWPNEVDRKRSISQEVHGECWPGAPLRMVVHGGKISNGWHWRAIYTQGDEAAEAAFNLCYAGLGDSFLAYAVRRA